MPQNAKDVLGGLAVFLVVVLIVVAFFGTILLINNKNAEKQERLNELCISEGYNGWVDHSYNNGSVGCE